MRLEFSRVNQALGEIRSLEDVRLGLQLPGHQKAHSGFIFFLSYSCLALFGWQNHSWRTTAVSRRGQQKGSFPRLFGPWAERTSVFISLQRMNWIICLTKSLVPEGELSLESHLAYQNIFSFCFTLSVSLPASSPHTLCFQCSFSWRCYSCRDHSEILLEQETRWCIHFNEKFLSSVQIICCICAPYSQKASSRGSWRGASITGHGTSAASAGQGSCWKRVWDPCTCWNQKPGSVHRGMLVKSQQILSKEKLSLSSHQLSHWCVCRQTGLQTEQGGSNTLPLAPVQNPRGTES